MPNERTNDARTELRSWYLHSLQPKLARAATTGAVDPLAVAALDAEVRSFLDLYRARTTGAPAGAIMAEGEHTIRGGSCPMVARTDPNEQESVVLLDEDGRQQSEVSP